MSDTPFKFDGFFDGWEEDNLSDEAQVRNLIARFRTH